MLPTNCTTPPVLAVMVPPPDTVIPLITRMPPFDARSKPPALLMPLDMLTRFKAWPDTFASTVPELINDKPLLPMTPVP